MQARQDVEETVRRFAEESDVLEGLQLMCDPQSAWGGLAGACTTQLADDYSNQTRLLYSVQAAKQPSNNPAGVPGPKELTETLSVALATAQWCRDGSLVLPMHAPASSEALKGLQHYNVGRDFHSSALLAAALDTATLPFRIAPLSGGMYAGSGVPSEGGTSMSAWCAALAQPAANVACMGVRLPAESTGQGQLSEADMRLSARERRLRGISEAPQASAALVSDDLHWLLNGAELMMDSVVWRGPRHNACSMAGEQAAGHLRQSLAAEGLRAVHQCCAAVMPLPVPLPFPDMFTAAGGSTAARQAGEATGEAESCSKTAPPERLQSCPMLARSAASGVLEGVLRGHGDALQASCRAPHGKACLRRWDIEVSDVQEQREFLLQSADLYTEYGWPSDEDDVCFD